MEQYKITGMSCSACQVHVEKAVQKIPGVTSVNVSLLTNSMAVEGTAHSDLIVNAVENAGYGAIPFSAKSEDKKPQKLEDTETPLMVKRLIKSIVVLIILMYFSMGHMMLGFPVPETIANPISIGIIEMLLSLTILIINKNFFINGVRGFIHRSSNMDTLVAMGSGASFLYSLVSLLVMSDAMSNGYYSTASQMSMKYLYFEAAAMIPTLITIGKTLESYSKGRTTDALKGLLSLAPKTAVLIRDGVETVVDIQEVRPGDVFIVKPGENIPVDGIITSGNTAIDESSLTGESIPVDKVPGDEVSSATINQSGYISCRATRVGEDTTLSQIIKMVEEASATKAPLARIADKVSGIFVPIVIIISLCTLVGWMIAGMDFSAAFQRAVSVLVIACPCALGLATPVAIMVGNGLAAKNGILYKTASSLENTGRVNIVALDKTGTVTNGTPQVTDIIPAGYFDTYNSNHKQSEDNEPTEYNIAKQKLLQYSYSLEKKSEHPLAKAINKYADENNIAPLDISDFNVLPGNGLTGNIDVPINVSDNPDTSHGICGGNLRFIESRAFVSDVARALSDNLSSQGKTPLFFAEGDRLIGIIAVSDTIRDDSHDAIKELHHLGIKVVMLTGDNKRTADYVASKVRVDAVISDVLPGDKESIIRDLQKQGRVAMVGDGINDAPALVRADVGIAIGAGTDVAIDAADVVLVKSRLRDVPGAIRLSRETIKNIHENLFWAFFYNIICIPLAIGLYQVIFGWSFEMKPVVGALAMSLSSVTVCLNALRLNLFKVYGKNNNGNSPSYKENTNTSITTRKDTSGSNMSPIPSTITCSNMCKIDLSKYTKQEVTKMTKTINIQGMMCNHCEASVKGALTAIEGVESAEVSHEAGTAVVTLTTDVSDDVLKSAVESKDYTVTSIE